MKIISQTNDFRRFEPEVVKDRLGNKIEMILCEELDPESGRWEPFYAIRNGQNVVQSK